MDSSEIHRLNLGAGSYLTGSLSHNIRAHSQAVDSVCNQHILADERGDARFREKGYPEDGMLSHTQVVSTLLVSI